MKEVINGRAVSAARLSTAAAVSAFILFSVLGGGIFWVARDRARLIRDNDNERILNQLFWTSRNYGTLDEAAAANGMLKTRITGLAFYDGGRRAFYRWGAAPETLGGVPLEKEREHGRPGFFSVSDRKNDGFNIIFQTEETGRERDGDSAQGRGPRPRSPFPEGTAYFFAGIKHPAYWRTMTASVFALPAWELLIFFLIFYFRFLYLRNREYRERIEKQKNLVVLGSAASTLAHEIKNPLLSIRLQTGILGKILFSDGSAVGREEISRINEEVDRISALIYRVNDYLRDEKGKMEPVFPVKILRETSMRLCGRDIISDSDENAVVEADPARLRSVFENLISNALESGGNGGEIGASVKKEKMKRGGEKIVICIHDRGRGITKSDRQRIFDPFFTTKSSGAGIGLALCKRFVEAAGGSITVENREDGGARAVVSFPPGTVFPEATRESPV